MNRWIYFVLGWLVVLRAWTEQFWRSEDHRRMQMMLDAQDMLIGFRRGEEDQ